MFTTSVLFSVLIIVLKLIEKKLIIYDRFDFFALKLVLPTSQCGGWGKENWVNALTSSRGSMYYDILVDKPRWDG